MHDEYQLINISLEPSPDRHGIRKATVESTANRWSKQGWETVSVIPARGPGYADAILVKRKPTPMGVRVTDPHTKEEYYVAMEDVSFIFPEDGM